jgi:O-methyltransferase involved in polyketide biosynthesis
LNRARQLAERPLDEAAPTFFSWLGVTQYLTMTAIEGTLRWVAARPSGSEIVFSYVPAGPKAELLAQGMAARRVPLETVLAPAEITRGLLGLGFKSVEHLTDEQATQAYFQNRADGLRFPDLERLVSGVV